DTLAALMAHDWPGNVRELRNVLERALALGGDPGRLVAPLGHALQPGARDSQGDVTSGFSFVPGLPFREQKERWNELFERSYVRWLLTQTEGNISKAARSADMDRKYLHKLMRKYGVDPGEV